MISNNLLNLSMKNYLLFSRNNHFSISPLFPVLFCVQVPMTRLRKRVATRLKDSQTTFALLTTFNEVDM